MWTYDDEIVPAKDNKSKGPVVTNVRKAPRAPANNLTEAVVNFGQDLVPTFQEAYRRATDSSGAGTGEIGASIRGIEDLFNLDDRFQQATEGGTSEEREDARDSEQVKKVRQTRAVWNELDKLNPDWRKDASIADNVARVSGSFLGDMAGNANPTYLIGAGRTALARAGVQGGVNAGIDAALQGGELNSGIADEFDPKRVAIQFLAGAALQGGGEAIAKGLGLGRGPEPDFDSAEHPRELIEGATEGDKTDADFALEMQEALQRGAPAAEIEEIYKAYGKTPEGRPVSSDYGADAEFNDADEAFTNALVTGQATPEIEAVVKGMEAEAGPVNLDAAEVEAPSAEIIPLNREEPPASGASEALLQLRKMANDMHMDAEVEGGKYPLVQLVAIHKKINEKLEDGSFKGADLEEAQNIKAFLDEAITWRDQAENGISVPDGTSFVEANRGSGDIQRTPANDVEGVQLRPTEEEAAVLGDNPSNAALEAERGVRVDPETGEVTILRKGGGDEPPIDTRPVSERLTEALEEATVLSREQKKMYTEERRRRLKEVLQARNVTDGEAGYRSEASALKGQFDRVDFEGVRHKFTPEEVDNLFDEIKNSEAFGRSLYEPITARAGLAKLLDGEVPAPSQLTALEKVFGKEFVATVKKHRARGGKVKDILTNALNLPRSLMASMDLSAPLRQGIFLIGSKEFWKAWPEMFKAFGSERAFKGIMDDIQSRETFPLMEESKLAVTDLGGNLSNREEDFISQWAEKIPIVGRGVKASERAYVGFLNKLRADTFDNLAKQYADAGIDLGADPKALKDVATFVNNATGRGSLGKTGDAAAPWLNGIFFSPRLIASRANLLNPVMYAKLDPIVRKKALKSLISFGTIASTVAGLASMAGFDVETDPRSSDFAKIREGDTRYDILGGFGQYLTLGARLATNETKTLKGTVKELGKGYKADTRKDVVEKFFTNKFAPVPGYIRDYLQGSDPVGKEFDVTTDTAELFVPLLMQDLYELYEEDGVAGLAKGAPGVFGVGIGNYAPKTGSEPKEGEEPEEDTAEEEDYSTSNQWTYED